MKDKTTAIILSALLGGFGVDRFYLGYTGLGVLKLLTAGCFGVLWILDIINIATGKLQPADGRGYAANDAFSTNCADSKVSSMPYCFRKVLNRSVNAETTKAREKEFDSTITP